MTPEQQHYQQVQNIVDVVLKHPREERQAYLDSHFSGDEELRREVERLIAQEENRSDDRLNNPLPEQIKKVWKKRYELQKELGRGGFGIVHLAHDREFSNRPVAVKELLDQPQIRGNAEWRDRFLKEIVALSRLPHPSIVQITDSGEVSGSPFLVMEYVSGPTLEKVIPPGGMQLDRVVRLMRQICEAIDFAHKRQVFHRDLKPNNLMLQIVAGEERIKVMDFGIAKVKELKLPVMRGATPKTMILGTPPYMAPEQVDGDSPERADLWALGVIAYEMLTGCLPFDVPADLPLNSQGLDYLKQLYRAGIKPPQAIRPDLPAAVMNVLVKATAYEADDRHSSADELGEALAHALLVPRPVAVLAPSAPTVIVPQYFQEQTTKPLIFSHPASATAEVVLSYAPENLQQAHEIVACLQSVGISCRLPNWQRQHHEIPVHFLSRHFGFSHRQFTAGRCLVGGQAASLYLSKLV